ncbi:hypothetical protein [Streptomyces rubiginosohelvolus]|uniref:hypothetical protein n=1 Tax=Streptomyces rubiginosohelvolus TaxID=67362 RepID=UPI0036E02648
MSPKHPREITLPETFGQLPRPRILILGFEPDEDVVDHIKRIAPTVRLITKEDVYNIRQEEWDAVVTRGRNITPKSHLNVFQVGGEYIGQADGSSVSADWVTSATYFVLPDDCPPEVRALSRSNLLPAIQQRETNEHWTFRPARGGIHTGREKFPSAKPFLTDADDKILAGKISGHMSETWWLPDLGCDLPRWVSAALQSWSTLYPDRFPLTEEWKGRDQWVSPEEAEIKARLAQVEIDLSDTIAKLENARAILKVRLEEKSAEVDATARRLLTAQGDELVDQVENSLEELGFLVTNVDKKISSPGDRREDLRVSDPDLPDWTAIAEVRGYSRGAQLNDLLRLGRFTNRYLKETGKEPSSTWYVVNQEMAKDPDTRQSPLASNSSEVETFAESGGLVIDTRDLFKILMMVRQGTLGANEARRRLTQSSGYFQRHGGISENEGG